MQGERKLTGAEFRVRRSTIVLILRTAASGRAIGAAVQLTCTTASDWQEAYGSLICLPQRSR